MTMKITFVTDFKLIDRDEWSAFINKHPKGSVFQTPEMFICYLRTPNCYPIIIAAYVDNVLSGILVSTILREKGAINRFFSKRAIIQSGPIVINDEKVILELLLERYLRTIPRDVIYTQIRNQFDVLNRCDSFREYGFIFKPHLNYLVHLDSVDNIWGRIGKGRKQQIRKAIRKQMYVTICCSEDLTDEKVHAGYDVISEVYRNAKLPLTGIEQILEARNLKLLVAFFVHTPEGTIAGCRFALKFNKTLYGWYAGSYKEYYSMYPNDLLIWETLRWAHLNDYNIFDYGGAGDPNKEYGVRDFKAQVGGQLVDFGRFEKVHRPLMKFIGAIGFSIYRKLFSFR